jgi:hypothetical protein
MSRETRELPGIVSPAPAPISLFAPGLSKVNVGTGYSTEYRTGEPAAGP